MFYFSLFIFKTVPRLWRHDMPPLHKMTANLQHVVAEYYSASRGSLARGWRHDMPPLHKTTHSGRTYFLTAIFLVSVYFPLFAFTSIFNVYKPTPTGMCLSVIPSHTYGLYPFLSPITPAGISLFQTSEPEKLYSFMVTAESSSR